MVDVFAGVLSVHLPLMTITVFSSTKTICLAFVRLDLDQSTNQVSIVIEWKHKRASVSKTLSCL